MKKTVERFSRFFRFFRFFRFSLGSCALLMVVGLVVSTWKGIRSGVRRMPHRIRVFSAYSKDPVSIKTNLDLHLHPSVMHQVFTVEQQSAFLESNPCMEGILGRFRDFVKAEQLHLAQELWKYCALYENGGMYLDADSPLLLSVDEIIMRDSNVAVLSSPKLFADTLQGSLLLLKEKRSRIAEAMIHILLRTPMETLVTSPLYIPKTLYNQVNEAVGSERLRFGQNSNNWWIYQHECSMDPLPAVDHDRRLNHVCPTLSGYCCQVRDAESYHAILVTRHPLLPFQVLPPITSLGKPINEQAGYYQEHELPFISTITQRTNKRPNDLVTPNLFEILLRNECLPSDLQCNLCLRDKQGANCSKCASVCPCYCKTLCNISVEKKFVSKVLTVTPPAYSRDPSRLVPRIIHQTWFEKVSKEKYPNMSRLIESFKQSGWEYKFYTDDVAAKFLDTHFPPEIRQAYDALRPGAFKADLFRYCVLLIHGGVYADMDVMLESNLDFSIPPDVGFMVPVDAPGTPVGMQMCLWNGLIAAAPGHPFLAKIIETVVNNIRNRFTSVDVDYQFCPNPELSVLHAFETLFTAGPCIMGSVVNRVLGRHPQAQFDAGPLNPLPGGHRAASEQSDSFVLGVDDRPDLRIPGRSVILHQNKWDMGAHRFTLLENNLVVAATDMPDYDDREHLDNKKEHYSKTRGKAGIYGLEKLYTNMDQANEDIRILVDFGKTRFKVRQ